MISKLAHVVALGTTPFRVRIGQVGFKISIGQLFDLTRTGLLKHFKSMKLLHSVRRDRLAQAVSHYIAKASGQWSTTEASAPDQTVPYSAEDILRFLRRGARLCGAA